jgi:hypothetical protein
MMVPMEQRWDGEKMGGVDMVASSEWEGGIFSLPICPFLKLLMKFKTRINKERLQRDRLIDLRLWGFIFFPNCNLEC